MDWKAVFDFYKDKKILVTGHTGFKGSWTCRCLELAGAKVCGYALEPPTEPSLYALSGQSGRMDSIIGDIRDLEKLDSVFESFRPEIVIHMAAQPIVRESYKNPVYTFETNVMGTVNICECVRRHGVRSFLNVTTDKVYDNKERAEEGYREEEPLDGYDPYSNSKSCSELVTHSYARSFLKDMGVAVSTARAGNVIGGGDFAADRIIPDCVRAALAGKTIVVRNPASVRPYQHVLEPVAAYLMIAMEQYNKPELAGWYNVGPDDGDCITTGELVECFARYWDGVTWKVQGDGGPHEAGFLKLNCTKLKCTFGWKPQWNIETAVAKTVEFSRRLMEDEQDRGVQNKDVQNKDVQNEGARSTDIGNKSGLEAAIIECMDRQIKEYMNV